MSERVSSVEIEDVLSSIRRLVSEELRPGRPLAGPVRRRRPEVEEEPADLDTAMQRAPLPAQPQSRLILTASLRVSPPATGARESDAARPDAKGAEGAPSDVSQDDAGWGDAVDPETEDPLAGTGWAMPRSDAVRAAEDDEPADALPPAPEHRFSFSVARAAFDEKDDGPDAAEPPETPADKPKFHAAPRLELTADLAVSAPPWAQPVSGSRDDDKVPPREAPRPRPTTAFGPTSVADAAEAAAIRNIESLGGDRPAAFAGQAATKTVERRERVAPTHLRTIGPSEPPIPGPQNGLLEQSDENPEELILEEAMLREIIREVVREELAGSLGSRITRNVRKLVRGEIAQMLASRTLE